MSPLTTSHLLPACVWSVPARSVLSSPIPENFRPVEIKTGVRKQAGAQRTTHSTTTHLLLRCQFVAPVELLPSPACWPCPLVPEGHSEPVCGPPAEQPSLSSEMLCFHPEESSLATGSSPGSKSTIKLTELLTQHFKELVCSPCSPRHVCLSPP